MQDRVQCGLRLG